MNITTLLHNIRDAVHDDSATQTWCTSNYSRHHKVYVGIDTRKPPAESEYPIVHIFPINKVAGFELEEQDHGIGIVCGLYNENMAATGKTNAVEFEGIEHIETFRKKVETAITGTADLSTLEIAALSIEYETIEFFPFFLASMELKLTQDYYQGDDVFA